MSSGVCWHLPISDLSSPIISSPLLSSPLHTNVYDESRGLLAQFKPYSVFNYIPYPSCLLSDMRKDILKKFIIASFLLLL